LFPYCYFSIFDFGGSFLTETFPFSQQLKASNVTQSDPGLPECDYYANFTTDSGQVVGNLVFRIEPQYYNYWAHKVDVFVQHTENTQLDSIVLKFDSSTIGTVYFAGKQSMKYDYSRTLHSYTVKIQVDPNLGSLQGSSILDFIVTTPTVTVTTFSSLSTFRYITCSHYN
jgi:hypothetical protein